MMRRRFWNEPERGKTGDHGQSGQDGRDGRRGETGERGPMGSVSQGETGERGQRGKAGGSTPGLRLRMLVLYVVTMALIASVGFMYQRSESERARFEKTVVANCNDNRDNTIAFNKFIDRLIKSYYASNLLTAKEKDERASLFREAKGNVPKCPPDGVS